MRVHGAAEEMFETLYQRFATVSVCELQRRKAMFLETLYQSLTAGLLECGSLIRVALSG